MLQWCFAETNGAGTMASKRVVHHSASAKDAENLTGSRLLFQA